MILTSTADASVTHVFSYTARSVTAPKRPGCREPTPAPATRQIGGGSTHSRLSFAIRHTTGTTAQFTKWRHSDVVTNWSRLNRTPAGRLPTVCSYRGRRPARTLTLIDTFKRLRLSFPGFTATERQSSKQATCRTVSDVRTSRWTGVADPVGIEWKADWRPPGQLGR
jgi:hypothetical protein